MNTADVAIRCDKPALDQFIASAKENNFMPDRILNNSDEFILQWRNIKWNEDFPEVKSLIEIMDKLDDANLADYKAIIIYEEDYQEIRGTKEDIDLYLHTDFYISDIDQFKEMEA